eukprot:COSAG02_NODE_4984_length_4750_cov_5.407224_8_plen_150_part_00
MTKARETQDRIRSTAAAEAKQREEDAASRKLSVEMTTEQIKRLELCDGAITTQSVSIVGAGDIVVGSHVLSIDGNLLQSQSGIYIRAVLAVLVGTDDGQDGDEEFLEDVSKMDVEELESLILGSPQPAARASGSVRWDSNRSRRKFLQL